jgi:hypothetical protein
MSLESAVVSFHPPTIIPFRWERYYKDDKKYWQAACKVELRVELDSKLDVVDLLKIEYRQYIRGGVWIRLDDEDWTADNAPNGNDRFKIPAYAGQSKVAAIPMHPVTGVGLSLKWKEDGEVEGPYTECYGYRATATVDTAREADAWLPLSTFAGTRYLMRDTPSLRGEWKVNQKPIWVWIELYFKGFVVEVEPFGNTTRPIRVLKERSWSCLWMNQCLSMYSSATQIS